LLSRPAGGSDFGAVLGSSTQPKARSGFLCKFTPAGRKVFMVQYRTREGARRKPAIGQFGEFTVEQARTIAQGWLAEVRNGGDPSAVGSYHDILFLVESIRVTSTKHLHVYLNPDVTANRARFLSSRLPTT
jgi:Arm DNA-binding domain